MLLLPEEVEKERGVIMAEMRDRDGVGRRLWKRSAAVLYAGTVIAERSPIGVPETIATATPALLRDYYDQWYTPDRMVLAVSVRAADGTTRYEGLAVNDCVVTAGAPFRMIELALRLDGENGPEFLGDGIIIATPVGSTAYNASAGGPIVHPDVEAIIVTPNAAHSLAFRPVVVPASLAVQAHVVRANEGTTLVLDGHINVSLRVGDTVVAKRHHDMARIVARPDSSYWETLVDKMRWAESPNYRAPGA
jgi:NAD+ kinase